MLSLAGEPSLAGDFSLTGKPSLAGEFSLVEGFSLGSWWGCSAPTQISNQISAKTEYPCAPHKRRANHILTLGAALEKGCRVRQGCLGRATCCRSGLVLDDDHRGLGPLCCSLGQSPKEEQVQRKASEKQDKQQGLKKRKYSKRSLLFFFFLVGAERGEVEVRRAPGARRRRRSFPWPLGGSSGGGLRRPRSGCRCGVSSGRN